MKKFFFTVLILCLFCGCKVSRLAEAKIVESWYNDWMYDIYRYTQLYYCRELKYPTYDELWTFCWNLVNSANNYRFSSYEEYENTPNSEINGMGAEALLHFLSDENRRKDFSLEKRKDALYFCWKKEAYGKMKVDIPYLIQDAGRRTNFYFFYNDRGEASYINDEDQQVLIKGLKDIYKSRYKDEKIYRKGSYVLIRYSSTGNYKLICPKKISSSQYKLLEDLKPSFENILYKNGMREIQYVIFL